MCHADTVSRISVANTIRDLPPSQPVDIPQRENEPDLTILHALNIAVQPVLLLETLLEVQVKQSPQIRDLNCVLRKSVHNA